MNFSEFKRRLGSDPWALDPEVERARRSAPEFARAAEDAAAFERRLQAALQVPTDARFAETLIELARPRHSTPRWLALAAALVLAIGAGSVAWFNSRPPQDVRTYVVEHVTHDGADLLARASGPVGARQVAGILTDLGVTAAPDLTERVRLIKFCPTPDGRGAHMVLDTDGGPVQLIFMPATTVEDGDVFDFDGVSTHLVQLQRGSAAIVGSASTDLQSLGQWVKSSLQPYRVTT